MPPILEWTPEQNIDVCKNYAKQCVNVAEKSSQMAAEVLISAAAMPFTLAGAVLVGVCEAFVNFRRKTMIRKTIRKRNFK